MATDQPPADHPLAASQPWYRRLYDEAGPRTTYGYAVYYLPRVVEADGLETVQEYHDSYIQRANSIIGAGTTFNTPRFRLQPVPWPLSSRTDNLAAQPQEEPKHFIEEIAEQVRTRRDTVYLYNTGKLDGIDADDALVSTFQHLREHFKAFRSLPRPAYQVTAEHIKPEDYNGLIAGLLDNVFIVVNENSAYTWWDWMPCDRAWVWAVDPDFEHDKNTIKSGNGLHEQYRGYVRVRLQQLANWFYEARRFRPEVTLQDIWSAARQSTQYSFVSLDPEQYHAESPSSNEGSALRPAHLREVREEFGNNGMVMSRWVV